MGYCTYTVNKRTGGVVVAWIGTGKDVGCQKTIVYTSKSRLPDLNADRNLKCKDAARQFVSYVESSRCRAEDKEGPLDVINKNLTGRVKPTYVSPETQAKNDATRKQYCSEVCAKDCGIDPFCNYAKSDCKCGGSFHIGGMCDSIPLPPPFNDCLVLGGIAIVAVLAIMLLKK